MFDNEDAVGEAIRAKEITPDEKTVIVLRYLGPKGGPGMPEMLKTTSLVMGAGLGMDVACVTDGRFSGGTHGFTVGHVVPVRRKPFSLSLHRKRWADEPFPLTTLTGSFQRR